jgi:hypothetical protein
LANFTQNVYLLGKTRRNVNVITSVERNVKAQVPRPYQSDEIDREHLFVASDECMSQIGELYGTRSDE